MLVHGSLDGMSRGAHPLSVGQRGARRPIGGSGTRRRAPNTIVLMGTHSFQQPRRRGLATRPAHSPAPASPNLLRPAALANYSGRVNVLRGHRRS